MAADHQTVDTSRPFRTVKEAITIFSQLLATDQLHSPSPKPHFTLPNHETPILNVTPNSNQTLWKSSPEIEEHNCDPMVMKTLKKLELELEETKRELNILKERESETEIALASLNAELRMNMSKIAKAEAEAAGNASAMRSSAMTLRQVLNVGGGDGGGGEKNGKYLNEKKGMKKKPVIPLFTDLFIRKNGKDKNLRHNQMYTSSPMYWN